MTEVDRDALVDAALGYARERGWPVHAIVDGKGRTLGYESRDGVRWGSTTDAGTIEKWRTETREVDGVRLGLLKIGIPTGPVSGLLVIDVDDEAAWEACKAEVGAPDPYTLTQRTGRDGGGRQFVFAYPEGEPLGNSSKAFPPGIDVRGDGGQFVAPPSVHESGRVYAWVDETVPVAPLPGWIVERLRAADPYVAPAESYTGPPATAWGRAAMAAELAQLEATTENRNDRFYLAACRLSEIANGGHISWEQAADELRFAALGAGLERGEVPKTLESARKKTAGKARGPKPTAPTPAEPMGDKSNGFSRTPGAVDLIPATVRETDVGNGLRLVKHHGERVRYVPTFKRWVVWNGERWEPDEGGLIVELAKDTVRRIHKEVGEITDEEKRKRRSKWAFASEAMTKIDALVKAARTDQGVVAHARTLDTDPWLLNTQSGTIDLRSGEMHEHSQTDLITKLAPVAYDPAALAPSWEAFLDRIFAGKTELIDFVQRALGYSLTGSTDERIVFVLYGTGKNGKSVLLNIVRGVLGDYAMKTPTETLMKSKTGAENRGIARLKGARFVTASEAEEGDKLATALIKDLSGGESIAARKLYEEQFEFAPEFKLWLSTNYRPEVSSDDQAIWDRLRLIPFDVRIPHEERVLGLAEKIIEAEGAGVLAWAVRGALAWQRDGLGEPAEVMEATAKYRSTMDALADFFDGWCNVGPDEKVTVGDLYIAYTLWCEGENVRFPLGRKKFTARVEAHGFAKRKASEVFFYGLSVKPRAGTAHVFGDDE